MGQDVESYNTIVVGSGFAGAFYLHKLLQRRAATSDVLWLERGRLLSHKEQASDPDKIAREGAALFDKRGIPKKWIQGCAFGGGSNLWWGCTPRMLPEDFQLRKLYGYSLDWPLSYGELEPYYNEAESIMHIAGEEAPHLFPRSQGFPQPAHRKTDPERMLALKFPGMWISQPCARLRLPVWEEE